MYYRGISAPVVDAANRLLPEVAKALPDITHPTPESIILGPVNETIKKAVDNYCDHNTCDPIEVAKATGIPQFVNKGVTVVVDVVNGLVNGVAKGAEDMCKRSGLCK